MSFTAVVFFEWLMQAEIVFKYLCIENCTEVKFHSVACFPQGVKRGISGSAKVRDVSVPLRFIAPTEPLRVGEACLKDYDMTSWSD